MLFLTAFAIVFPHVLVILYLQTIDVSRKTKVSIFQK